LLPSGLKTGFLLLSGCGHVVRLLPSMFMVKMVVLPMGPGQKENLAAVGAKDRRVVICGALVKRVSLLPSAFMMKMS
jgi:hypothetical protein